MRFLNHFFDLKPSYKVLPLVALILFESSATIVAWLKFFFALDFIHKAFVLATIICGLAIAIVLIEEMFHR